MLSWSIYNKFKLYLLYIYIYIYIYSQRPFHSIIESMYFFSFLFISLIFIISAKTSLSVSHVKSSLINIIYIYILYNIYIYISLAFFSHSMGESISYLRAVIRAVLYNIRVVYYPIKRERDRERIKNSTNTLALLSVQIKLSLFLQKKK